MRAIRPPDLLDRERLKLAACLWLAGMAGVVALSWVVLPQLLQTVPSSVPVPVAVALNLLQNAALVGVAVWVGILLAKPVGLQAPVIESALARTGTWSALKPRILPAAVVGLVVGSLLAGLTSQSPEPLRALGAAVELPLWIKMLYGGITEEILMRWGLMTALVWLPWRLLQNRTGPPKTSIVVTAIVLAAILFGVGHLPAAVAMGVELDGPVVLFIVVGNAVPGILFGWLYWRWGLEAAVMAHALSHAAAALAPVLGR